MKKAAIALLFVGGVAVAAPTVTFQRWQDMAAYVGQLTTKVNEHTADIAALEAEVAALKAWRVVTDKHIANIITAVDIKLRFDLAVACDFNRQIEGWVSVLPGVKAVAIPPGLTCPPVGAKLYNPYYISTTGPLIPTE